MGTQLVLFTTGSPKLWAYETWGDKGYHQNGGMGGGAVCRGWCGTGFWEVELGCLGGLWGDIQEAAGRQV